MSVSFIRIDDRMIHGQTCTRWAREYPCDGLVAVNDKAANNSVLNQPVERKHLYGQWKLGKRKVKRF